MPLKKGSSRETISANIAEMVDEYKEAGHIGTSHPADKQKAVKQATAIALTKAGRSRKQTGTKKPAAKKSASQS
jgi:hypothetical protein